MNVRTKLHVVKSMNKPTIEELEHGMVINEHQLERACAIQPDMFYRVAKAVALETSQRDATVQALKEEEAKADCAIRRDAEVQGDRVTDKAVEAMKILDKEVVRLRKQLHEHNARLLQLNAIKEAFIQRGYALKEMVALHINMYYGDVEHSNTSLKTARAGKVRSDMSQMRRTHHHETD